MCRHWFALPMPLGWKPWMIGLYSTVSWVGFIAGVALLGDGILQVTGNVKLGFGSGIGFLIMFGLSAFCGYTAYRWRKS